MIRTIVPTLMVLTSFPACGEAGSLGTDPRGATVFRDIRIFEGEKTLVGQTVVISDGIIRYAASGTPPIPEGAIIIDGRGKTLLPGFIDAHGHLQKDGHLRQAINFGVTTVLDMFMQPDLARSLRERARDEADLADFRSAVTLVTAPGGHGTEYGVSILTISSPGEASAFVDARIADGADYIKIVYDDGSAYGVDFPTLDRETLEALIDAAHARGKIAVVHVLDQESARTAVESGADGLMHTFADRAPAEDFAALVKKHGAFVVPTLSVLNTISGTSAATSLLQTDAFSAYLSNTDRAQLESKFTGSRAPSSGGEWAAETVRELGEARVPLLAGSDAPNPGTLHGVTLHGEIEMLVKAGLTSAQALAAATSVPADRFGLDDRGRIAPGRRADLLLVRGDPSNDIGATRQIAGVWKQGVALDRTAYAARIAQANRDAQAGLVSDFEDGTTSTSFGFGWVVSTDRLARGRSSAEMRVEEGGSKGSKYSLRVTGNVESDLAWPWAGVTFAPGPGLSTPADLSSRRRISFSARGDGKDMSVIVFTADRPRGVTRPFTTAKEWHTTVFPIEEFLGIDSSRVTDIFIGSTYPGAFSFAVDDVRID